MRQIDKIIIHCTATRANFMAGSSLADQVAEVRRWHVVDNKWSDIGYHFLIGRNGEEAAGRSIERVGAHAAGHNTGSIGISLFGGHGSSENDRIEDHFTPAQIMALRKSLRRLKDHFPNATIHGHNEFAAKACPGFNVQKWQKRELLNISPAAQPKPAPGRHLRPLFARLSRFFGGWA